MVKICQNHHYSSGEKSVAHQNKPLIRSVIATVRLQVHPGGMYSSNPSRQSVVLLMMSGVPAGP